MVIMMDNEGPYERAARSLETVVGGLSTPVDVRTECEDLRAENKRLREMLYLMTSLTDWLQSGFTLAEYETFCDHAEAADGQ